MFKVDKNKIKMKYLLSTMMILSFLIMNQFVKAQTPAGLEDYLLKQMKDNNIPGMAVAVTKNAKVIWAQGYGYADLSKDIPFTPNTILPEISSISNTVTSTALMQLLEKGLLKLNDPINNYLPFPVTNPLFPAVPITFLMLLTHTSSISGIAINPTALRTDLSNHDFDYVNHPPEPLASYIYDILNPGGNLYANGYYYTTYSPGSHYTYSNYGYALLGYLVERISGMPFDRYCNQNIFDPLCMNNTGWYFSDVDTNIVARPYHFEKNKNKMEDYGLYELPDYPAAQLKTSIIDLSRFLQMHANYGILNGVRILDSATVALIRTKIDTLASSPNSDHNYGLGWENYFVFYNSQEYWGHFGTDLGVFANMYNSITNDVGVIVFVNNEFEPSSILLHISDVFANSVPASSLSGLNCSYTFNACEQSANYWKNNSSQWALNSIPMKIGTKLYYTAPQTLDVLNKPVDGDASIHLAQALIAAKLNVANGSELSPIILAINAAMNLIGDKRVPFDVPITYSSPQGVQMIALAARLSSYNSGSLNTTPCSGPTANISRSDSKNIITNSRTYSLNTYPNPVLNSATIIFSLSHSEKVSIKIFDISGRLVKTLADKQMVVGDHQLIWDIKSINGNPVPSGIYFVKFTAGNYSETKKLSVIK
jgi:CubicO group peptidase (beta-lactamase class C family)